MAQELLCNGIIRYDTRAKRAHRDDIALRAVYKPSGLLAEGKDLIRIFVVGSDRRFADHYSLSSCIYYHVR